MDKRYSYSYDEALCESAIVDLFKTKRRKVVWIETMKL